jgi:hypothetical protein
MAKDTFDVEAMGAAVRGYHVAAETLKQSVDTLCSLVQDVISENDAKDLQELLDSYGNLVKEFIKKVEEVGNDVLDAHLKACSSLSDSLGGGR